MTLGSTSLCHHRCFETFICNLSFQMVDIFTEKLYCMLLCLYIYHSNTLFVISFLSHLLIDSSIATTNSLKNIFSSRKDIFSFTFVWIWNRCVLLLFLDVKNIQSWNRFKLFHLFYVSSWKHLSLSSLLPLPTSTHLFTTLCFSMSLPVSTHSHVCVCVLRCSCVCQCKCVLVGLYVCMRERVSEMFMYVFV